MWRYERLNSDEPSSDEGKPKPRRWYGFCPPATRSRWVAVLVLGTTILLVCAALYGISLHLHLGKPAGQTTTGSPPPDPRLPPLNCGLSRAEALAKGCRLDVMADAWLPSPCFNETAAAMAFSRQTILSNLTGAGIFDWYADANHTAPVSLEDLAALDSLRAFTWQVYHLAHCIYSWQTMVRALNRVMRGEKGVYVHSKLLDEDHVHHCAMVLAANGGEDGILRGTAVEVRFGLGECVDLAALGAEHARGLLPVTPRGV
ncbi:hypothetical protein C8A03DRAFT_30896 [Achaetomium macrosporum]|uniref:Uncharacterized protein n=1 Tax=Achaetomium macrosporum TaxID=79813 RepID=A0AAN7CF60_9PEZI|nr:hypothetical protein C8A03DRAFT_30896 [Achaetomium macrosporum]